MLAATDISHFVNKVGNYFSTISNSSAVTGVPYVTEADKAVIMNYTGVIAITGAGKGCLYITADEPFFKDVSESLSPGLNIGAEDVAGELANTIAGNVRQTLGSDFAISVPIVIIGIPKRILPMRKPIYTIPILWQGHKSYLVIGVE